MKLIDTLKMTGKAAESFLTHDSEKMDILDTLHKEHDEVSDLLAQLVKSESGPARKNLLKKIKAALVPHARAEEKIVYDAIITKRETQSKIDGEEGYIEHELADKMLADLSKITSAGSPEFSAAAKVLKELVEHHVKEEESNVWRDVRTYYTHDQRIDLNRKYIAAKKKVRVA